MNTGSSSCSATIKSSQGFSCSALQVAPEVAIAGKVFRNMTLRVTNVFLPFLTLLNGMTYYVSVRATSGGAQRLTAVATSAAVKASPSFHIHTICPGNLLTPS